MDDKLIISSPHSDLPDDAKELIRKEASRLERFSDRIVDCEVTVHSPSDHHRNGVDYHVAIRVGVPGPDIQVSKHGDPSLEAAVKRAFEAAKRKLHTYSDILHHKTKNHVD